MQHWTIQKAVPYTTWDDGEDSAVQECSGCAADSVADSVAGNGVSSGQGQEEVAFYYCGA